MTNTMAAQRLAQPQPAAQHGILGNVACAAVCPHLGALRLVGAELVAEPGIFKELAGLVGAILGHQNTARQNAD